MLNQDDEYIHFPLVTVAQAARFLGVGRKIIYQLVEFDRIRAVREKGSILIEKQSLEAFRDSGQLT